ncbi:hydroxyacid dehydrogenase [Paracraurococcus lichenis]|uniref:Hydroxyacid dehydrogenase n=1 Tax=Paracraurococcus lichenis TaxID=3064888 RepID=A0ABT9DZ86_9PROT|nr:hydroxyacid dehydrogenase [Paracraurococcus sp. LOR1-02]MDO9709223.1 hydroxyacid dehydrogenase [Paracraurococcus sp. LOR1-02]
MPHVVCLRSVHEEALAMLRNAPGVTLEVLDPVNAETIARAMPKADAIIVRATRIDRDFLQHAPNLRIVARHGVGYDAVDVEALTERGIPLTVTPDANAVSVAEHAMMLMLNIARGTAAYDAKVRKLEWITPPVPATFDLAGRTVLVMGFGRIGGRVARLCAAFGMNVLVRDPYVPQNTIKGAGFTPVKDLHAGLAAADIVTVHLPSNKETRGFVNGEFIAGMKRGAVLINTARGTLVEEKPLAAALANGHLAAAGLDVFWEEPAKADNPLLKLPNVVLTPHSAAATEQSFRRMGLSCADSILACFENRLDEDVVINKEVLRGNA